MADTNPSPAHPSDAPAKTATMPAEWMPHDATWVSWPRNRETWPKNLADARREFVALVRAIAADEPVRVLAGRGEDLDSAQAALGQVANVEFFDIQTNDAWARDYAPTFAIDHDRRQLVAIDWIYNAWGGKYPPFDQDQRVAERIATALGIPHAPIDLCLEGGALEVDDQATLLCTRSCAFDVHRNPELDPPEIEARIMAAINAQQVIWLAGDALIGDDTDGHIDQLARFTPSGSILYAWTDDRSDSQFAGLNQNLIDLREGLARLSLDRTLIPLPIPSPVFFNGVQIPACYCNFYITNDSVLVPAFGAPQDDQALQIVAEQFPGRRAISLPSVHLTVGLGSFHCLTQQQPRVP